MQKLKDLFCRLKQNDKLTSLFCYIVPFIGLGGALLGLLVNGNFSIPQSYYLLHYLYTYNHGFVGRGLVGEVISWFYDTVSDELILNVIILFSVLLMVSATLCIGKALTKVKNNPKLLFIVALLCLLICVLPGSFRNYYRDLKVDKLLWVLTLFSVFIVDRRFGIWFVPVFCVLATLINPVFLFSSMILIAIILLQEFYANGFSKKHGVICAVSYLSMIALGIFALVSEKYLGFETPGEMVDYYFARYSGVLDSEIYKFFETAWLVDYFNTMDVILQKGHRNILYRFWELEGLSGGFDFSYDPNVQHIRYFLE